MKQENIDDAVWRNRVDILFDKSNVVEMIQRDLWKKAFYGSSYK